MSLDIEDIMDEIEVVAKVWIPYYSWQTNQEKNDTLLGQLDILTSNTNTPIMTNTGEYIYVSGDPGENGFYMDAYYTWYLTDFPVHKVSFLQTLIGDPVVSSLPHGEGYINRYTVALFSFIKESFNSDDMPRIKARYNRVFSKIVQKQIAPNYNGVAITAEKASILEDPNGSSYSLAGITFTIEIAY